MPLIEPWHPLAVWTRPGVEDERQLLPQLLQEIFLGHQVLEGDELPHLEDRKDKDLGVGTPEGRLVPGDHPDEARCDSGVGQQLNVGGKHVVGVGGVAGYVPVVVSAEIAVIVI